MLVALGDPVCVLVLRGCSEFSPRTLPLSCSCAISRVPDRAGAAPAAVLARGECLLLFGHCRARVQGG